MTYAQMAETALNGGAALAALIAGGLWLYATRVDVPAPAGTGGVGAPMGGYLITLNSKGERIDLHATYLKQGEWNGYAACATAIAAVLAGTAPALKALGVFAT